VEVAAGVVAVVVVVVAVAVVVAFVVVLVVSLGLLVSVGCSRSLSSKWYCVEGLGKNGTYFVRGVMNPDGVRSCGMNVRDAQNRNLGTNTKHQHHMSIFYLVHSKTTLENEISTPTHKCVAHTPYNVDTPP